MNGFDEVLEVKSGRSSRNVVKGVRLCEENNSKEIGLMSKSVGMYEYGKVGEKKNVRVGKIDRVWVRDLKDEKKWGMKSGKMSSVGGVYGLEYDKGGLRVRGGDREFRGDG